MTSEFEDQAVDSLDVSELSDSELKDIVDHDSRSTAQDKAQAELNRRESDSDSENDNASDTSAESGVTADVGIEDPKARAEALGLNAEGINTDPEAGQAQVQAYFDKIEESGTVPPTGPPTDVYTVAGVTRQEQAVGGGHGEDR